MDNWIPFGEGEYLLEQALLVAANDSAVAVDDVVVEVYADQRGRRHFKGRGRVRNILMVELLEDSDDLLKEPIIQAGMVFAPDARSVLQFYPQTPWQQIPPDEFDDLMSRLRLFTA